MPDRHERVAARENVMLVDSTLIDKGISWRRAGKLDTVLESTLLPCESCRHMSRPRLLTRNLQAKGKMAVMLAQSDRPY